MFGKPKIDKAVAHSSYFASKVGEIVVLGV